MGISYQSQTRDVEATASGLKLTREIMSLLLFTVQKNGKLKLLILLVIVFNGLVVPHEAT